MAGLTRKGEVYYALFTVNGKVKWKRIGKVSYKDVREYIKKLDSKSDRDKLGLINIKPVSFNDLIGRYLNYSSANKAVRTFERDIASTRGSCNSISHLCWSDLQLAKEETIIVSQINVRLCVILFLKEPSG